MKILHVIDSAGLYGAETMLLHLMTEQVQMGLQPVLASIGLPADQEKPIEAEARRCGLQVIPFRIRSGPNWVGAFAILHAAHAAQVDVLHSHGYKGNILFGLLPRWLRRLPLVSTLHGWTSVGGFSRLLLYEWIECVSLRCVDRVIMVNENMRNHPRLARLAAAKLDVIENGISIDVSESVSSSRPQLENYTRSRFTYGAIGRLSPEKGFDILLEAFAGLVSAGNDVQLVILGEGEQRTFLETLVKDLGLEKRVLLPGFVPAARNYLSLFDVFVMSSLTEGLPMVLLEAMAAEIPIVATRVGGIPQVLGEGCGGDLVEAGNKNALQNAMASILKDPRLAQERSVWSVRRVRQRYSSRAMAFKYTQVYQKFVKNDAIVKSQNPHSNAS